MFFPSTFIAFSFPILYTTISLILQQLIRGGVKILQQPIRLLALYRLLDLRQSYQHRPLPFTLRIFSGLFTVYQVRQALLKRCGIAKLAWQPISVVAAYQCGGQSTSVVVSHQRGGQSTSVVVSPLAQWLITSAVVRVVGKAGYSGVADVAQRALRGAFLLATLDAWAHPSFVYIQDSFPPSFQIVEGQHNRTY